MNSLTNILPQDGKAYLVNHFIDAKTAGKWYQYMLNQIAWQQYDIKLFGKSIQQPRLSAWYGETGTRYTYSGLTLNPIPFTKELLTIKNKIEQLAKTTFNSVLLNLYRDGNDSMGWHSDDEKELGQNPIIASLSLGSARLFVFRHKHAKEPLVKLILEPGSLLIMKGTTQRYWQHSLPKTKQVIEPRINLTFRRII
ncbi:MAG: alpha-ketoglutarate-dependent dioxygenase AlkB [Bacteroidota bacterium]|nr:alpha-ketoglutarate-dependent dioxygenase AlkB [Bacteroidota bacterium]